MNDNRKQLLVGILALLWVVSGTAYYYVNHKPFSPSTALILGEGFYNVLVASLITTLAGGLGSWIIKGVSNRIDLEGNARLAFSGREAEVRKGGFQFRPVVLLVLEAGLGYGVLGLGVLLFGSTVGVKAIAVWAATAIILVALRKHMLVWLGQWRDLGILITGQDRIGKVFIIGLGLILFFTLLIALAPPVKFDALVYHLTLPEIYLDAGRITYTPGNMFWGMPQTVEMLYTWTMALAGAPAAVALSWIMAVLAGVGLVGFVSQFYDESVGWAAGAILLGGYSLAISTAWGYVDWAVFLFGFGFFAWLVLWRIERSQRALLLAGLMAGMALGTKYTAGLLIPVGVLLVIVGTWGRKNALRSVILFGFVAALVVLPWWGKNFLATGNPFYPLLFPGGEMDAARLDFYQDHHPWGTWLDVVLLPFRATFLGLEGNPGYGASIGPLLLFFGSLSMVGWGMVNKVERAVISTAGGITGLGILVWILASRSSGLLTQTRLYLSIFPAIVFLAGVGLQRISGFQIPGVRLGRIARILIGIVLWLNVIQVASRTLQMGAPRYHFGLVSSRQYLEDNLGWYARAMEAVRALPEGNRVVTLWEARGYYCNPVCESDEVLDRWVHQMRTRVSSGNRRRGLGRGRLQPSPGVPDRGRFYSGG